MFRFKDRSDVINTLLPYFKPLVPMSVVRMLVDAIIMMERERILTAIKEEKKR